MTLGYDNSLYLMAFDRRGSFEHDLFGSAEPVSAGVRAGITTRPPHANYGGSR
jgi:hypothetical protein